jgi:HCOMODA/2-hydroxy-3-carboxy-muconic semialdehyde decarboxylase
MKGASNHDEQAAPVIPFGLTPVPMRAMFHNAGFLAAGVPVHDIRATFGTTDLIICDCERGADLAAALGDRDVVLMRAHGSVATGPSLPVAVFRAVYTEVNARISHWTHALADGAEIAALSAAEGGLADAQNAGAALRAWELWRTRLGAQTGW